MLTKTYTGACISLQYTQITQHIYSNASSKNGIILIVRNMSLKRNLQTKKISITPIYLKLIRELTNLPKSDNRVIHNKCNFSKKT